MTRDDALPIALCGRWASPFLSSRFSVRGEAGCGFGCNSSKNMQHATRRGVKKVKINPVVPSEPTSLDSYFVPQTKTNHFSLRWAAGCEERATNRAITGNMRSRMIDRGQAADQHRRGARQAVIEIQHASLRSCAPRGGSRGAIGSNLPRAVAVSVTAGLGSCDPCFH